jgi:hypothetical protein
VTTWPGHARARLHRLCQRHRQFPADNGDTTEATFHGRSHSPSAQMLSRFVVSSQRGHVDEIQRDSRLRSNTSRALARSSRGLVLGRHLKSHTGSFDGNRCKADVVEPDSRSRRGPIRSKGPSPSRAGTARSTEWGRHRCHPAVSRVDSEDTTVHSRIRLRCSASVSPKRR